MKTVRFLTILAVAVIILTGCGTAAREIQSKSQDKKTNVFAEVKGSEPIPKGYGDLVIKANIKTHLEGYYIGESKESLHGKPEYPFLVNIDGQAVVWKVEGVKDSKPKYEEEGKTSRDPEAGEGMKYTLDRRVRLRAGSHKVFFGLPEDKYFAETEIALNDGETYDLEFKPIYRTKRIPTRIPTFLEGINRYEVFLNGNRVL
jgi:hypothetical protein